MFTNLYTLFLLLIFCEAATKIGLGNGRPSEEPSSLKTEIMKFKTSECGGSSSEEVHGKNKKQKNRRKNYSNEDDDDDDSEEDKKKKNSRGKNNNQGRQKNNHGVREEFLTAYGSTSFEGSRNFGMNRRPEDDYMNRRDPFQNRWDDSRTNTRNNNNQYSPYEGTVGEDFYSNNQRPNNRNQDRQDPYGSRPGSAYNRGGYPPQERDEERYYNRDDRYNRDSTRDRDSNRDSNRNSKRKGYGQNNWNESQEDDSRNSGRKNGSRKPSSRSGKGGMNKKNKNDSSDRECISQCVFNNMEIMEDDGIPSESGMIKWAQDKIKNEKLKQAAIKEIRKCFGTLASSDGENSCNFSKSLAQCLKLGLDDDKD